MSCVLQGCGAGDDSGSGLTGCWAPAELDFGLTQPTCWFAFGSPCISSCGAPHLHLGPGGPAYFVEVPARVMLTFVFAKRVWD